MQLYFTYPYNIGKLCPPASYLFVWPQENEPHRWGVVSECYN